VQLVQRFQFVAERFRHWTNPDCILQYNAKMGGVDKSDQLIEPCDATRKSMIWHKKLSIHLIQNTCKFCTILVLLLPTCYYGLALGGTQLSMPV